MKGNIGALDKIIKTSEIMDLHDKFVEPGLVPLKFVFVGYENPDHDSHPALEYASTKDFPCLQLPP